MQAIILLDHNENTKQVESEEKSKFLREFLANVFESTETADKIEEIWIKEELLSIRQKLLLRKILSTYNIDVIDDLDGRLIIYIDNQEVAKWNKPIYKLKRDYSKIDRKKQLYLEMIINYTSIFDKEEENVE